MKELKVKYYVLGIMGFLLFLPLILNTYPITPASAACTTSTRADGLISAKNIAGKFGTTASGGACITGDASSFVSFKVPTYAESKQVYYDGSKATKTAFASGFPTIIDGVYLYTGAGDLSVPASILGSGTAVIFVPNNLTISSNITYGSGSTGLVFVVSGNINIASTVTRIDAVLISGGTIYTAGANCSTSSVGPVSALTINGSVVSLSSSSPPKFCRYLSPNTSPAEIINHQPKYLVILRNLFAGQLQIWKELSSAPAAAAAAFDYTIINSSMNPVTRGQSGSTTVTIALTASASTNQNVILSASGLPDGATTTFSTSSCAPRCISTLTIGVPTSVTPGNYVVTVTGSPLSKTTTFTLTVN